MKINWKLLLYLFLLLVLLLAGGFLFFGERIFSPTFVISSIMDRVEKTHPLVFLSCLSVLPLFGVPISPLWIMSGTMFGPINAFLFASVGLFLNLVISHFLCRSLLRPLVIKIIGNRQISPPNINSSLALTLAVRITPGVPLFLQNYLLGIWNVPFVPYVIVSMPLLVLYAAGFIFLGRAFASGSFGWALTAVGILLAVFLIRKVLKAQGVKPSSSQVN